VRIRLEARSTHQRLLEFFQFSERTLQLLQPEERNDDGQAKLRSQRRPKELNSKILPSSVYTEGMGRLTSHCLSYSVPGSLKSLGAAEELITHFIATLT